MNCLFNSKALQTLNKNCLFQVCKVLVFLWVFGINTKTRVKHRLLYNVYWNANWFGLWMRERLKGFNPELSLFFITCFLSFVRLGLEWGYNTQLLINFERFDSPEKGLKFQLKAECWLLHIYWSSCPWSSQLVSGKIGWGVLSWL